MDWGTMIATVISAVLGLIAIFFGVRWSAAKQLLIDISKAIEDNKIDTEEGERIVEDVKRLIGRDTK